MASAEVGSQLSVAGLYLPPEFSTSCSTCPPHTIISEPVHTAVWSLRPSRWAAVGRQESVAHGAASGSLREYDPETGRAADSRVERDSFHHASNDVFRQVTVANVMLVSVRSRTART